MSKEITKAIILQEIQDKFKLRDFEPAKFLFEETVIPVYEISEHLQHWATYQRTVSVTSTGAIAIKIIPPNEKWLLRAYSVIFVTGVYTVAGAYILRRDRALGTDFSYLDLTAAQSVSYLRTLPEPVTLEAGDTLLVNIDGYTSTGDLTLHIDYRKEEIR